jgi:hypothetical protein
MNDTLIQRAVTMSGEKIVIKKFSVPKNRLSLEWFDREFTIYQTFKNKAIILYYCCNFGLKRNYLLIAQF